MTTTTTISIKKVITKMTDTSFGVSCTTHKLGEFAAILNTLTKVQITGTFKPSKLAKYEAILANSGFALVSVTCHDNCGFDGLNADVIYLNKVYAKA